jgi:hypothetical protein
VDRFAAAGGTFTGAPSTAITIPPSVPDAVATQIQTAATTAMGQGFATSVSQSLLLGTGVLLLGLVAALVMRATHVEHGAHPEPGAPAGDPTPAS